MFALLLQHPNIQQLPPQIVKLQPPPLEVVLLVVDDPDDELDEDELLLELDEDELI